MCVCVCVLVLRFFFSSLFQKIFLSPSPKCLQIHSRFETCQNATIPLFNAGCYKGRSNSEDCKGRVSSCEDIHGRGFRKIIIRHLQSLIIALFFPPPLPLIWTQLFDIAQHFANIHQTKPVNPREEFTKSLLQVPEDVSGYRMQCLN